MIYKEYRRLKDKYELALMRYDNILENEEALFTKTQPNAIRYDKVNVLASVPDNMLEQYIQEYERLEKLRESQEDIIKRREDLMLRKEKELRDSKEKHDIVYVMRYLDREKVSDIMEILNYSRTAIYRILAEIERN